MSNNEKSSDNKLRVIYPDNSNIFSRNTEYIIPLYQRGFAWKGKQIRELIDDVYDFDGDTYYIGSIVVAETSSAGNSVCEVIDGQQRLTCLFLLLNYIYSLNCTSLEKPEQKLVFACREKSKYTLENILHVIKKDKSLEEKSNDDDLIRGLEIISQHFAKEHINVRRFVEQLKKVVIFKLQVPPHTDLNRYFEIMNTRGEQLEQQDIVKAKLMSCLETEEERNSFAVIWNSCSDMRGYVQMYYRMRKNDKEKNSPRVKIFEKNWNKLPSDNWNDYSFLQSGDYLPVDDEDDDNSQNRYKSIIEFDYFLMHVLKSYCARSVSVKENTLTDKIYIEDRKLLADFDLVLKNTDKKEFVQKFIVYLLRSRFLFDKFIVKRYFETENSSGEWTLKAKRSDAKLPKPNTEPSNTFSQKNWGDANEQILMLESCLRVSYTNPKYMGWITKCISWLLDNTSSIDGKAFETECEKWIKEAVKRNVNESFDAYQKKKSEESEAYESEEISFDQKLIDSTRLGTGTPHIIFNYLDYLLWKEKKSADFKFEYRDSVEHWYPQHPSDGTFDKWEEQDGQGRYKRDYFGNLCLIQKKTNSRFSNLSPESKRQENENDVLHGSMKLREMNKLTVEKDGMKSHEYWREVSSFKHEKEMQKLLLDALKK